MSQGLWDHGVWDHSASRHLPAGRTPGGDGRGKCGPGAERAGWAAREVGTRGGGLGIGVLGEGQPGCFQNSTCKGLGKASRDQSTWDLSALGQELGGHGPGPQHGNTHLSWKLLPSSPGSSHECVRLSPGHPPLAKAREAARKTRHMGQRVSCFFPEDTARSQRPPV